VTGIAAGLGVSMRGQAAYDARLAAMTARLGDIAPPAELVRYATLAANGHNTQPWRFVFEGKVMRILPDFTRRTPVVDPDDHHLFASLGCAAENLSLAARATGASGEVRFEKGGVSVDLSPAPHQRGALFQAVPERQTTRGLFDGSSLRPKLVEQLVQDAAAHGVEALWTEDATQVESLLSLVIEGNSRQMDDPAFVGELKAWIRFNPGQAARMGDGLFSGASGNPSIPGWLGPTLFDMVFRKGPENDKYAQQVRSSAGLMVLVADTDDPEGWVQAGRAFQRMALRATSEGVRYAFVNQAVEVPGMRAKLRAELGLGGRRPNLVIRLGRGPALPRSLRRPVEAVFAA